MHVPVLSFWGCILLEHTTEHKRKGNISPSYELCFSFFPIEIILPHTIKVLLKNNHIIARNLVVKLAEYAKGRKLNLADLRTVDQIVKNSAKSNYTFRTMLGYMLESDLMMKH